MSLKVRVRKLTERMSRKLTPRRQYLNLLMEYIRVKREAREEQDESKMQEAAALRVRLETLAREIR